MGRLVIIKPQSVDPSANADGTDLIPLSCAAVVNYASLMFATMVFVRLADVYDLVETLPRDVSSATQTPK